ITRERFVRIFAKLSALVAIVPAKVDLACSLNKGRELQQDLHRLQPSPAQADKVANAAVLACLGSAAGHARVLRAVTSPNDDDVQIAQIYLRHRPLAVANERRVVATGITRMSGSEAQVRALDTLAGHRLSDRESL